MYLSALVGMAGGHYAGVMVRSRSRSRSRGRQLRPIWNLRHIPQFKVFPWCCVRGFSITSHCRDSVVEGFFYHFVHAKT